MFLGAGVLRLMLFTGGIVAALMLRRRDPKAALLTGLGFGFALLSGLIAVAQRFVIPSITVGTGEVQAVVMVIGLLIGFVELGGLLLIFLGLLRLVRGRRPAAPDAEAVR